MRLIIQSSIGGAAPIIMETYVAAVEDWTPFFETLADPWAASRVRMYQTRGASVGRPWLMYDETQEQEVYRWAKSGILGRYVDDDDVLRWDEESGKERLYPSLTDPTHNEFVFINDGDGIVIIGTAVPYARRIHYGEGEPGPDWMPEAYRVDPIARALIDPGDEFVDDVVNALSIWLGQLASGTDQRVEVGLKTADILSLLGRP